MIPYSHQSIHAHDIRAVVETLKGDFLTQGPAVAAFERALSKSCRTRYAVAVSSGTAALHAAYAAVGLTTGDEFITSPLTFAATANAGLYLGARPIFADIDERGNLDPKEVEKKITRRTKLIVAVDYAGFPAQLAAIRKISRRRGVALVEDACHALGAYSRGKPVGSVSDLTVFSFHPVKSIATGEGGAILTNTAAYYKKLLAFRTHGITKDPAQFVNKSHGGWYQEMQSLGFNYRLTDMQAALGTSQLRRLKKFIQRRRAIARQYDRGLRDLAARGLLELPAEDGNNRSSWHLYVVRLGFSILAHRAAIFDMLRARGIGVQVHYLPVYIHPYYRQLGYKKGICPKAEQWYASCMSIPLFPDLSAREVSYILAEVRKAILFYVT